MFKNKKSETPAAESTKLLEFFSSYSRLLEMQLGEVRVLMGETVEQVMRDVNRISSASELRKKDANTALIETFISPGEDTQKLVVAIQDSVTDIFDQAVAEHRGPHSDSSNVSKSPQKSASSDNTLSSDAQSQLRRAGGRFTKHLEAMDKLDSELREILFSMISALSADDVIAQRIEHISLGLNLMMQGLRDSAEAPQNYPTIYERVLKSSSESYTTEQEKQIFRKVFSDVSVKIKKLA